MLWGLAKKALNWGGGALSILPEGLGEGSDYVRETQAPPTTTGGLQDFERRRKQGKSVKREKKPYYKFKPPVPPKPKARPKRQVVNNEMINISGVKKNAPAPAPAPSKQEMKGSGLQSLSAGQKVAIGAGIAGLAGLFLAGRSGTKTTRKTYWSNRLPS